MEFKMSEAPNESQSDPEDLTFEDAFRELERLVSALESGRGNLEDALTNYERAVRLTRICRQKLDGAARRIEMIKGINDSDELVVEELDETSMLTPVETAGRQIRAAAAKVSPTSETSSKETVVKETVVTDRSALSSRNTSGSGRTCASESDTEKEGTSKSSRAKKSSKVESKPDSPSSGALGDSARPSSFFDCMDEPPF